MFPNPSVKGVCPKVDFCNQANRGLLTTPGKGIKRAQYLNG